MTTLADFYIIGAMKCGTTTLQAQLVLQDGVFMTTPKEPNFFSDDDVFARGMDWYQSLFDDAQPGDLKGEASTHYTKLPTYPKTLERLQAATPAPKLIYMIRNPLERAVSHYIHSWTMGDLGSDPVAAFDADQTLTDYGRYAMQIRPYISAFGVENIFLTSLEQVKSAPDAEFARIAAFLGLPDTAQWHHDLAPQNVSKERIKRFPMQKLLIDNPVAAAMRRTLVPQALRDKIKQARQMPDRPQLTDAHKSALSEVFLEDRATLATYFPDHPALKACYPFA